jgi:2-keto-3-deoxy-L-rhamnonate aldolase RhmA
MNGCEFKRALHEGRRVYGTMIISSSPEWPIAVQQAGLDFVFFDTEHIALDRSQISWMCRAYSALGLAPIVRIPSPDPCQVSIVLDGGAEGVIAPYVETPDEVRRLSGAVKYKPLKGKRLNRILEGEEKMESELRQFLDGENQDRSLIVNIESVPAIEALDEILAVPGLDAVLIGPHDLSISLGIPLQYDHPRFTEAADTIIRKARAAGIGAGLHAMYPDPLRQEIRWAQLGANLIIHGADILAFRCAMQKDIEMLRQSLGDRREREAAQRRFPDV